MKQTILLTGASGAVGYQALCELLRRRDQYQIRILSLGTIQEWKLFRSLQNQIEIIWGDIRNIGDVHRAVENVDIVLHIAGIIPPLADYHPALAYAVNVGGTSNIVEALKSQGVDARLIFTSSISVYGDRIKNPNIEVGDPLSPSEGDEYARTKIAAERIIQDSGTRWSIFRLCGILVKRLKIQPLMFHMPLNTALEWCHEVDAGYALVQAAQNDALLMRTFNLGGGKLCRIRARDFLRLMFPTWGLNAEILPDYAFATRNFHSGYFTDGNKLEDLLHFQRHTLLDYFAAVKKSISPAKRLLVKAVPRFAVRQFLLNMSEPLKAVRQNNQKLIQRFYGSREAFEDILAYGVPAA